MAHAVISGREGCLEMHVLKMAVMLKAEVEMQVRHEAYTNINYYSQLSLKNLFLIL